MDSADPQLGACHQPVLHRLWRQGQTMIENSIYTEFLTAPIEVRKAFSLLEALQYVAIRKRFFVDNPRKDFPCSGSPSPSSW